MLGICDLILVSTSPSNHTMTLTRFRRAFTSLELRRWKMFPCGNNINRPGSCFSSISKSTLIGKDAIRHSAMWVCSYINRWECYKLKAIFDLTFYSCSVIIRTITLCCVETSPISLNSNRWRFYKNGSRSLAARRRRIELDKERPRSAKRISLKTSSLWTPLELFWASMLSWKREIGQKLSFLVLVGQLKRS